jgi:hypothetical protein
VLDHLEVQFEQASVMRGHAAGQRLDQGRAFVPQRPPRQVRQLGRIGLAGDERAHDRPPAHAEDIAHHPRDLEVGDIERLLDALGVLRDLAHDLFARPGQIPYLLDCGGRHKAPPDQAMGEQIGNPLGILHITLAAWHAANVAGIRQHQRERRFQQVPDRFPVRARRFHPDVRDALLGQPRRQLEQLAGRGAERAHLVRLRSSVDPDTGGHPRLCPNPARHNGDTTPP